MYGYIEEGAPAMPEPRRIAGGWFVWGRLPLRGAFSRQKRRRFWHRMQQMGVHCAVLPDAAAEEAARYGITPVPVHPLRRALLEELLLHAPALCGRTVRLSAPYVSAEVARAALILAQRARYLDLQVGQGRDALARQLQQRFGLAVGAVGEVTLTVCFHGAAQGRCLCLGEDCEKYQQVVYRAEGTAITEERLLAALFDGGYLKKEEIHIIQIKSIARNA